MVTVLVLFELSSEGVVKGDVDVASGVTVETTGRGGSVEDRRKNARVEESSRKNPRDDDASRRCREMIVSNWKF